MPFKPYVTRTIRRLQEATGDAAMDEGVRAAEKVIRAHVSGLAPEHAGHQTDLTDLQRRPEMRGVHFKHLMKAADNLHKKGEIHYDGVKIGKPRAKESVAVNEDGGPSAAAKILARAQEKQTSEVPDSKGPLPLPHTIAPEPETPKATKVESEEVDEAKMDAVSKTIHSLAKEHGAQVKHQSNQGHRHVIVHGFTHPDHAKAFADKLHAAGHKTVHVTTPTKGDLQVHAAIHEDEVDTGISFADRVRHAAAGTRPQLVLDIKADPTVAGTEIGEASEAFADIIDVENLTVESLGADDHVVHVKYHLRSTEQAKKTVHHLVGAAMNHGAHGHDAEGYDGHVKFHFKHHDAAKHFANHAKAVAHVHTVAHAKPDESTVGMVPYAQSTITLSEARVMLTQDMGQAAPRLDILLAQFGGTMSEGGYEFPEPSKAQSFLNMYMVHGGRGYIRVPKSKDNPDGKAGPNESTDVDEVPGTFLSRALNAAKVTEAKHTFPEHLSDTHHEALMGAMVDAHRIAQQAEVHATKHGHLHPAFHHVAKAAREAATHAGAAFEAHMKARDAHRAQHKAHESVNEAKLPGVRVTDHEHVKPGDHVAWHGPLNGRTGTGPRVLHHGEVTHTSDAPQRMGKVVHVKVHTINGKPAHEHLDHDRVYKDVPHDQRHNVIHHEIHASRFSPHDNPIHKV